MAWKATRQQMATNTQEQSDQSLLRRMESLQELCRRKARGLILALLVQVPLLQNLSGKSNKKLILIKHTLHLFGRVCKTFIKLDNYLWANLQIMKVHAGCDWISLEDISGIVLYIYVLSTNNTFGLCPVQEDIQPGLVHLPEMEPLNTSYQNNIFPGLQDGLGPLSVGTYGQQLAPQPAHPETTSSSVLMQLQAERRKRRLEYQQNLHSRKSYRQMSGNSVAEAACMIGDMIGHRSRVQILSKSEVSSFTVLHYHWRLLGPFSLPI